MLCLSSFLVSLFIHTVTAQAPHGSEEAKEMGPVAFMWPPDREWGAAQDNTAPCGSTAAVRNRTEFPISGGAVALVIQDEAWKVQVAISYKQNPDSASDFTTLINAGRIPDVDPGHQCFPLLSPLPAANDVKDGSSATLQIVYVSDEADDGKGANETYYACADIRFVDPSRFAAAQIPCFNVSSEEFVRADSSASASSSGGLASASETKGGASAGNQAATTGTSQPISSGNENGKKLSAGAIAGIVIGVVAGIALVLAGALLFYRKRQTATRARQMETSRRAVGWKTAVSEEHELRDVPR